MISKSYSCWQYSRSYLQYYHCCSLDFIGVASRTTPDIGTSWVNDSRHQDMRRWNCNLQLTVDTTTARVTPKRGTQPTATDNGTMSPHCITFIFCDFYSSRQFLDFLQIQRWPFCPHNGWEPHSNRDDRVDHPPTQHNVGPSRGVWVKTPP